MQKKKKKRLKEFYGLCWGGGRLRTAYPFCHGSRHHSYRPHGPCWLIRMFHPKWGLIQSTIFPWGRECAGREQIPSIVYRDKLSLGRPLGVPVEPWYWDTSCSWKGQDTATQRDRILSEIARRSQGMWLLAIHILSLSLSFHICKMKSFTHQRFSKDLHRFPQDLATQIRATVCSTPQGFIKNAES